MCPPICRTGRTQKRPPRSASRVRTWKIGAGIVVERGAARALGLVAQHASHGVQAREVANGWPDGEDRLAGGITRVARGLTEMARAQTSMHQAGK